MTSPEGNNVKKSLTSEDDFVGEMESFIKNENEQQKPADEHKSTTRTPNKDSLESGKHESLLSNNIE